MEQAAIALVGDRDCHPAKILVRFSHSPLGYGFFNGHNTPFSRYFSTFSFPITNRVRA